MPETKEKKKILISLKKANTLLSKIVSMIEEDCYCVDVMQQNLAAIGLLRSAHEAIMANHLKTCFKSAMNSNNEKKKNQMIDEILKVTNLYNK